MPGGDDFAFWQAELAPSDNDGSTAAAAHDRAATIAARLAVLVPAIVLGLMLAMRRRRGEAI
jgi:hypothetical protein